MAAVALAAAATLLLVPFRRTPGDPPSSAVRDWSRIATGRLHLEMRSTSPAAVSRFFVERGIPFRVDPESLALPGFGLSGARVHAVGGRPSALAAHRDARNKIVVCQRFEGRVEKLPRPDAVVVRDGTRVHVYRSRRGRAVLWRDGAVIRSLASDLPEDALVRLAFSAALPAKSP